MKTHSLPISAMGVALLICACDKEAELALRPSVATFSLQTVSFSEKDGSQDVAIVLDKPAKEAGTLSVAVASTDLDNFTISPAPLDGIITLDVPKGSTGATLKIGSIDNNIIDGNKLVSFTLSNATRGIQIGTANRLESTWIDDESPSRVNFALERAAATESSSAGSVVTLEFSHDAAGDGQIEISLAGGQAIYGTDFTSVPEATNNTLVLPVKAGDASISFTIKPKDDALFNADRKVTFRISSLSPVLEKGSRDAHEFTIKDDELGGRAKAYISQAGNGWGTKRQIYYALNGNVDRVVWENFAPGSSGGEHRYFYNEQGQIEKVIVSSVTYIKYIRENGRIVKAEEYDNDELDRYTLYGYDQAGNVGETAIYDRQNDGSFVFSLDLVYLYHIDGNLYKKLAYQPLQDDELLLLSVDTYEHYIEGVNPFPIEIIHGHPIQNKLPMTYRHETSSQVQEYSISYEFGEGGRPTSRTSTGPQGSETASYEYY